MRKRSGPEDLNPFSVMKLLCHVYQGPSIQHSKKNRKTDGIKDWEIKILVDT